MTGYTAFCDESYITDSQYRAVAAVSGPEDAMAVVQAQAGARLAESNVAEFKWQKLTSARYRFAALKLIDLIFHAVGRGLRTDVLVWDTRDRRHAVLGRDDEANFARMTYHLLRSTMSRREPGATWTITVDEKGGIDWDRVHEFLFAAGQRLPTARSLPLGNVSANAAYRVPRLLQGKSEEHPLIQVADLCGGLAVFSRDRFPAFKAWAAAQDGQMDLFTGLPAASQASSSDLERFPVVEHVRESARRAGLPVRLDSTGGLRTRAPSCPMNFWWYEPQHEDDVAPVKRNRREIS